jgi:hypothetical protein
MGKGAVRARFEKWEKAGKSEKSGDWLKSWHGIRAGTRATYSDVKEQRIPLKRNGARAASPVVKTRERREGEWKNPGGIEKWSVVSKGIAARLRLVATIELRHGSRRQSTH